MAALLVGSAVAWALAVAAASDAPLGKVLDGVVELDARNIIHHAGNFDKHPTQGHEHVLVQFYTPSCKTCEASGYELRLVARTLRENSLDSKVMVARVNADEKRNRKLVAHFQVRSYPAVLWFSKGEQDWEARKERSAEELLTYVSRKLAWEKLRPVKEEDGVVVMGGAYFSGHAGNFDNHPVSGHTYALVNFYTVDDENCQAFAPTYRQVARIIREKSLNTKVLVAHLNASRPPNKKITSQFEVKEFPTLLWLVKDDQDWEMRPERNVDELLGFISSRIGEKGHRSAEL